MILTPTAGIDILSMVGGMWKGEMGIEVGSEGGTSARNKHHCN